MSSTKFDEDLDAFAESVAKRTADRESRLQRLAMLKGQQLENDEEELQKSTKKLASSTTNVISTSSSPVKSPQKQNTTAAFNYSSPSKNQFLPSFNSPQRSFVLTRSIEKSPQKNDQTVSISTTPESTNANSSISLNKTPVNSPEKQYIYNCSPKPYQKSPSGILNKSPIKSPLKPFMCHSPSQASIASNFQKKVIDFSSNSLSSSVNNTTDIISTASESTHSPTKSFYSIKSNKDETPTKPSVEQQSKSTSIISTQVNKMNATIQKSPVRLFTTVQSSNPIKVTSPIKQSGVNTPEKLCVSDKKKLFENAIKEETENAKRVQEQKIFLSRKKVSGISIQEPSYESPSMPKKIRTAIFEFENRLTPTNAATPVLSTTKIEIKPTVVLREENLNNTVPKILDVEMKQTVQEEKFNDQTSIQPGDDISKFIDQVDEETKFDNSLHSILEEEEEEASLKEDNNEVDEQLSRKMIDNLDDLDENSELTETSLIKSSTKANLYPSLCDLKAVKESTRENSFTPKSITTRVKSPSKSVHTPTAAVINDSVKQQSSSKQVTPMRTLSQYRREQKQRAANNSTPSNRLDLEKERKKEEQERARYVNYQAELKQKLDNLKMLIDKYEKGIEQSSNAIALCLKNHDQRNSSSQLAAEQILLISIQRRDACRQEIESIENKMKSNVCRAPEEPVATGCISIDRIQIPLKGDFIVGQISDQDPLNHHFICLARCGEVVLETELLDSANSIQQASIIFDLNKLQFEGLDKDFEIHFELYGLALPKEKVHHDKRSLLMHSIKIPPLSPKLTRSKKAANQIATYSANQGFTRLGFVKFNWNNILDGKYEMEEFMQNSPFNGQIEVDFKMSAVYNKTIDDFLNVYVEDKYWERHYYRLDGYLLAHWNRKEDYVRNNQPSLAGTIDLRKCINRKVGPVSLKVCPRSHSFALVTEDIKDNQYKDHKVHKITEQKVHIFAADLKEDFERWCNHLNKLLPLIRVWENDSHSPQDLKYLEN